MEKEKNNNSPTRPASPQHVAETDDIVLKCPVDFISDLRSNLFMSID